jgi:prolipoprotein diacylglyceryltransferase
MATVIFAGLWAMRKRLETPGALFALYLIANGLERFFIEKIRVNAELEVLGVQFTQAELISTLTFLSGVVLWFALKKTKRR